MLKDNFADLEDNGTVGDWIFKETENDGLHIILRYPNPKNPEWNFLSLPISLEEDSKRWKWNGNKEFPSLTPSILVNPGWKDVSWHGYLTDGKLITL